MRPLEEDGLMRGWSAHKSFPDVNSISSWEDHIFGTLEKWHIMLCTT